MAGKLVAIDATLVGGTGAGDSSYWTGLLSGLTKVESEFRFLLLSDAAIPPGVALPPNSFQWMTLSARPARWFSLLTMPLAARRARVAAFHTQYNLSPLVGKKGITTIHDVSFFVGPEWFKPTDRFLLRRFVPASAKRAAKVITVSEASKRDILRFIPLPAEKIVVTYNAADSRFRPVANAERAPVLRRLGLEEPYLLAVGTRWPRKNLRLAIEAAGLLPLSLPHKLVVTGKPGWGHEGTNPRVVATGFLKDEELTAVYSGASLYLCPSRYEGFGITVVEAFACGTPVLSSPGGGLREVVADAGELLEDLSAPVWAQRIEELLADSSKLSAMRERGLLRAKDFSWEVTARRTVEVYREVVHDG